MKKIYLLILTALLFGKSFSQCVSLGCAAANTGITTDGTLGFTHASDLGCYDGFSYEQIFWEFFYSPSGGDFTQTFTPTSGTDLSINFVILDIGTTPPASANCPVTSTGWAQIACDTTDAPNQPVGPGLGGITATTLAGHYYAVAIIIWQGVGNGFSASYTFDTSTPQIGGVDLDGTNCPGVLPVRLTSFTGNLNNCTVNLNWVAAAQANFKDYQVQYSNDGSNFTTIQTINAVSQGQDQKYSFRSVSPGKGTGYYRLAMVDVDGATAYSKIIPLTNNCSRTVVFAYPNPVKDILNVNVYNLNSDVTVAKLYNADGKLVYSGTMKNGTNAVNMSTLAKGIYLLNLKTNTESQNIKVIR